MAVDEMVRHKRFAEQMQPFTERDRIVKHFVGCVVEGIKIDTVPLSDPYGPAAELPDLDAIVVSEETLAGGHAGAF